MSEPHRIKKYSNRRLYDTTASRYVNLEQVAELVRSGHQVTVVDADSGDDLTGQVLTQIIVEEARDPEGGAPVEFLRDLVRATDRAQRDFFQWYLSSAAEAYKKLQEAWVKPPQWSRARPWEALPRLFDPLGVFRPSAHGDAEAAAAADTEAREADADAPPSEELEELHELRRRLEELERRLERR